MIIYLCVPVVDGNKDLAKEEMEKVAKGLEESGHQAALPSLMEGMADLSVVIGMSVSEAMKADGVLFTKGWEEDKRCRIVHFVAKEMSKFILF